MTSVRLAEPTDAAALAAFAARTFREAFEPDNTPENMALYLAGNFGSELQADELRDSGVLTLLVEDGRRLVGYAQLRDGAAPGCVRGPSPVEIRRFYVDRTWQGRGIAQTLMMAGLEAAGARGARTVWLAVWERNLRAQAFYRKCGFEDCGAVDFFLGHDRQTDRVMVRSI